MTEQPQKQQEKKSLGETLAQFMGGDEQSPVDVAMEMLNPKNAVMHTEIKDVAMMNKLALMIELTKGTPECEIWKKAYDVNVLHPVSKNRQRSKEIVGMFASLQAWYQSQFGTGLTQGNGRKGIFGRKQ